MRVGPSRILFGIYLAAVPILLFGTLAVFGVPSILSRSPIAILIKVAFAVLPLVAAWRAWVIGRAIKRMGLDLVPGGPSAAKIVAGAIGLMLVALGLFILLGGFLAFAEVDNQIRAGATAHEVGLYRRGAVAAFFLAAVIAALGGLMAWPLILSGLRGRSSAS